VRFAQARSNKSYYAEIEARRFSNSELHELLSVWFPRTAAFAVMRGGTLSHVVPDDPVMDIVGQFFVKLSPDDKARWNAFFAGMGPLRTRAMAVGLSHQGLRDWKDSLMEKLADELP
jgi:hypothetical protein